MEKVLSALLAAALLLSLAGCGGETMDSDAAPTAPDAAAGTQDVPSAVPDAAAGTQDVPPAVSGSGAGTQDVPPADLEVVAGTQTAVVEGFDWGPAVTKTILTLEVQVAAESVTAESFAVTEDKQAYYFTNIINEPRAVTAAYTSDTMGNRVEENSNIITLELSYDPNTGTPFFYDPLSFQNSFCDPYNLSIELTADSTLTAANGGAILSLEVGAVDLNAALIPQLEGVNLNGTYTSDDITLTYGAYAPAVDGGRHPLLIWLHGAGEGGTDPAILLLGNKVSALFGEEFQSIMGGAYVLTPQTPDRWMIYREEGSQASGSYYTAALMRLIESYVTDNPAIDTDRIYIGGCSNGGYMTMEMIMTYPDYFAATYPICEAYADDAITDEQLERIKNLPIWFIYAEDDMSVIPAIYAIPTIDRLRAMGGDVRVSAFEHVLDTSGLYTAKDGTPYQYISHWSWIYFFNNECEEDGVTIWEWLALQSR